MAPNVLVVYPLCLGLLASVLVSGNHACPNGFTCRSMTQCFHLHRHSDSISNVVLFSCNGNSEYVCCPPTPRFNPLRNKKLLPIGDCGATEDQRISVGQLADLGQFPWMVLLAFKINGSSNEKDFLCGGTLINNRYVLTAAHCVNNLQTGLPVSVRLGELDLDKDPDCGEYHCADEHIDVDVETVIPHKNYNTPFLKNDIALLRLKTIVNRTSYVSPICLPFGINVTGEEEKKYIVAGWGKVEDRNVKGSDNLLFTNVPSSPVSECNEVHAPEVRPINELQLCAGGVDGKDACKGDSGGPLMDTLIDSEGSARTYQLGIVSFAASPCGREVPSVYTRVSAYLTWILHNLDP